MQYSRLLVLVSLVLSIIQSSAQDIRGRWLQIQIPNSISFPNINILEISEKTVTGYDFEEEYSKAKLEIKDDQIILMDTLSVAYRMLDDATFQIHFEENGDHSNIPYTYVRLEPTICPDSGCLQFENQSFQIIVSNKVIRFTIGENIPEEEVIIVENPSIVSDRVALAEIEKTYFLCFYLKKMLTYAFPIREMSTDFFAIYGVYNNREDITATRIN